LYDLSLADGHQQFSIAQQHFIAAYCDVPAELGAEVVRSVIVPSDDTVAFEPVPVTIYGYRQGQQSRWELRIPGWLETFAVMDDQRKAQEAADGLTFHIGQAVLVTVMAKLMPNRPEVVRAARQQVGLVNNFGRMYSGMEPQRPE
jgi:hypothetical protein